MALVVLGGFAAWEFLQIRCPIWGSSYEGSYSNSVGSPSGPLIFGNSHMCVLHISMLLTKAPKALRGFEGWGCCMSLSSLQ